MHNPKINKTNNFWVFHQGYGMEFRILLCMLLLLSLLGPALPWPKDIMIANPF